MHLETSRTLVDFILLAIGLLAIRLYRKIDDGESGVVCRLVCRTVAVRYAKGLETRCSIQGLYVGGRLKGRSKSTVWRGSSQLLASFHTVHLVRRSGQVTCSGGDI